MALWDNITRKASAVTEKAVQQAKNLSELAKLHTQIADTEKTITDNYTQIGKLYAAAHPDDFEDCYAAPMAAISGAQQELQILRKQVQDLKGVAVCPKCGAEVAIDAAFCSACGAEMPKAEPVEAEVVTEDVPAAQAPAEEAPAEEAPAAEAPCETSEEA